MKNLSKPDQFMCGWVGGMNLMAARTQPIRPTFADLAKLAEQLRPTDIVPPSALINLRKKYTRRGHPPGSTKQSRNDQIMARLQTGTTTMQSVAVEFNITRERVRQIAKKYYGQTARSLRIIGRRDPEVVERERQKKERSEGRKHTRETKLKKLIELRDAGMPQAEIAEIMGVSQGSISARLCRAGIRSMIKHGSPPDAVRTHKGSRRRELK